MFLVSLHSAFGSLPCLAQTCPCNVKSTSCIDLSVSEPGPRQPSRPRILLKAPTLAEMEEMNISEVRADREGLNNWNHCWRLLGLTGAFHSRTCFVSQLKWVKMPLRSFRIAQRVESETLIEMNPFFAQRLNNLGKCIFPLSCCVTQMNQFKADWSLSSADISCRNSC